MKLNSLTFNGIPKNYGIVDNFLSRSGQPKPEDFSTLKNSGVTDIIDLRTHIVKRSIFNLFGLFKKNFNEKEIVEQLGMKYHSIPSIPSKPSKEKIQEFLRIMTGIEQKCGKAHIHCNLGADRTSVFVFVYQKFKNIGTIADNIKEWKRFGHHKLLFPNLIKNTMNLF